MHKKNRKPARDLEQGAAIMTERTIAETEDGLFLYEESSETPESSQEKPCMTLVPLSFGAEWYAADIENVLEVLKVSAITKVPNVPGHIRGVTNIRGNITSVTDLRQLFGLGEISSTPESRLVVIRAAARTTSLLTDSVGSVLRVPIESIQPALSTIPEIQAEYIKGEVKLSDGRLLAVLDLEKIMSLDQMRFE
jgi:purine-binding chemotaxis protein CheW